MIPFLRHLISLFHCCAFFSSWVFCCVVMYSVSFFGVFLFLLWIVFVLVWMGLPCWTGISRDFSFQLVGFVGLVMIPWV